MSEEWLFASQAIGHKYLSPRRCCQASPDHFFLLEFPLVFYFSKMNKMFPSKYGQIVAISLLVVLGPWALPCLADEDVPVSNYEEFAGELIFDVRMQGNHVTKDWIIAREIWTTEGEILDVEMVADDITRLENLAIFGGVVVAATQEPEGVVLNYSFDEMPWIIPYPAMNYTEENGFSIGVGVASPNFGGRGVALSGSAVFGGTSMFKFSASNPWISGNHLSAGLSAWHQTRRNELLDFKQTSTLIAPRAGKYIGKNGRLDVDAGYYKITSDEPGRTLNPSNTDEIWYGGVSLGYDGRDSWRVPHEGWHNEVAVSYMGGDANSWNLAFDVRRYHPVKDRHTIATGPYLGLQSGTVGEDVAPHLQFFVGGANSVRGYKLEELGKEIFGKNQFLYTLEYRYLVLPRGPIRIFKWSFSIGAELAAFGDAGLAWSDPEDFNLSRMRSGAGLGIRLLVPGLDSVRFDVARSEDGDTVFNFGVRAIFDERKKRVR
ncbi:MAG: outer membrane protein assembly factor BamA [Candidatus Krumholzibacteriia bacterium]|jgi:outer membrane protein assembly factor BamA